MSKPVVVAIDPGASGAVAVRHADGTTTAHAFESEIDTLELLRSVKEEAEAEGVDLFAVIEKVGGFVGGRANPGSAMFNFGRNFGYYLGVCDTLGFSLTFAPPSVWQKRFPTKARSAGEKIAHKRELKCHAARLYPKLKITLLNADALLILDWYLHNEH